MIRKGSGPCACRIICESSWDELSLLDDIAHRHIGTLIEELRRREDAYPIAFGDKEEPIFRKTHPVGNHEIQRRCKALHLIGNAILVAVGNSPDRVLARADECHDALRPDGHMPRIRNYGVETDLEAGR